MLHPETLLPRTATLIETHGEKLCPPGYLLAGGTALALYLGHRQSEDLDFMTMSPPDDATSLTEHVLSRFPQAQNVTPMGKSLHCAIDGVKVSYLWQPGITLDTDAEFQGLALASVPTLATLKCNAAANRGDRKDFVDLYALAQHGWTVSDLLDSVQNHAPALNLGHVLRSLTYFDDAEAQPMPTLLMDADWPTVKRYLQNAVVRYLQHATTRSDSSRTPDQDGPSR